MKKLIPAFLVVLAFVVGYAFPTVAALTYSKLQGQVLRSDRDNEILHPGAMLKSKYFFSSTDEAQVCTGKCALYDLITASGADGAYAIVYDSAPATAGTTYIFSKLEFDGTGIAKGLGSPNGMPIVTTNGISIDLSSVSGSEQVLVVYKDLD